MSSELNCDPQINLKYIKIYKLFGCYLLVDQLSIFSDILVTGTHYHYMCTGRFVLRDRPGKGWLAYWPVIIHIVNYHSYLGAGGDVSVTMETYRVLPW